MSDIKILGICGSLRKGSYNKKLLIFALDTASSIGFKTSLLDLAALNLPFFNEDIEKENLENVKSLKSLVENADIILISSPEYNYSMPAVLKNALDWLSRAAKNSLNKKTVIIMGASLSGFGTIRMQSHLRETLQCLNAYVVTNPQVFVSFADKAFSDNGIITDAKLAETIKALILSSAELYQKVKN